MARASAHAHACVFRRLEQVLDTRVKKAQVAAIFVSFASPALSFFASCVALQGVWRQLIAAEPRGPARTSMQAPDDQSSSISSYIYIYIYIYACCRIEALRYIDCEHIC